MAMSACMCLNARESENARVITHKMKQRTVDEGASYKKKMDADIF